MNNLMSLILATIVADVALFCEFTSEDLLDEDAAIEMMEQLSSRLNALEDSDKANLASQFESLSGACSNGKHTEFIRGLPASLGISD